MKQLPDGQYNFKETEEKVLKFWESKPFFKPEYNPKTGTLLSKEEMESDTREPWCLICPPPNAYDRPHMGNLSGYPYMDAMGRYERMKGKKVLLFPGKDHAGIEGEITYVKYNLEPEGKSKFDLKREDFYDEVWKSQQQFIEKIKIDEKLVGLSADFDRDLYTMDPKVVNKVLSTFTKMYEDGLIYKGVRIVNWDPKSQSAISDSQCERKEVEGKLYYITYKVKDEDKFLTVATTRPETIFGDTAVAINPNDERYKDLIGKSLVLPLENREIPIITSTKVEKDFGTGCLKVTPAHSSDDYEIMLEWNKSVEDLERDNPTVFDPIKYQKIGYINVIDKKLRMCGPIPAKYFDLKSNAAKQLIVEDLRLAGLLEKEETITQNLQISERTGATIEPIMSSQWFVDVSGFKQRLIDIVANGEIKIYPQYAQKRYFAWVNNLRDWAISRNLWWGYRLPVWYNGQVEEKVGNDGKIQIMLIKNDQEVLLDPSNSEHMKVQLESPGKGWIQDEDILDTWFSSGQWPYLCLESAGLMDTFFPTNVLVNAFDILIKWDLTMMLFSLYLTDKTPFKNLFLTGIVKGTDGQKMSKSKRNFVSIDEVKDNYGVDSFRMNCFYQNSAGKSYAITNESLKNFRNFNNKIWNASKFVMMNLEGIDKDELFEKLNSIKSAEQIKQLPFKFETDDLEMIDKLKDIELEFENLFSKFKFGLLTEKLYNEFWHTFCDIYIEKSKSRVWKDKETGIYQSTPESRKAAQATLYYTLKSFLKMLHPFIPFITEEIWQHLVEDGRYEEVLMYR